MAVKQLLSRQFVWVTLVLFIAFTFVVGLKLFSVLDTQTTVFIQSVFTHVFDYPFSLLSILASFEISTAFLIAVLLAKYSRNFKPTLTVGFLFLIGTLVELSGKLYLFHPSPPKLFFRNVSIIFPTAYVHTNYSYPSGHMFRVTFLVILLIFLLKGAKNKALLAALLAFFYLIMATSRIYLGEHWLSDVIGGTLLGLFFGAVSTRLLAEGKFS